MRMIWLIINANGARMAGYSMSGGRQIFPYHICDQFVVS
jgi:hypothetical protein